MIRCLSFSALMFFEYSNNSIRKICHHINYIKFCRLLSSFLFANILFYFHQKACNIGHYML